MTGTPLLEASHAFLFFDYLRVPYRLATVRCETPPGWGCVRGLGEAGEGRCWYWPLPDDRPDAAQDNSALCRLEVDGISFFGRVMSQERIENAQSQLGGRWRPGSRVRDEMGAAMSSTWYSERGDLLLPFDPSEAIHAFWSEAYRSALDQSTWGLRSRLLRTYYLLRPLLPRRVQIGLRRAYSRVQARTPFPRWPAETALHDLYGWLSARTADLVDEPVPWIAYWPDGHQWAFVSTHDVETSVGYGLVRTLLAAEAARGYRSSWNFVPKRYEVTPTMLAELRAQGCEIGVHGLYHDGRDLGSWEVFTRRLPEMQHYRDRWQAGGFRSPATHRTWEWMPLLGFDYDSSSPDTDPFEPQAGGCCSLLPFYNGDLVELPITLPQDHTIFTILGERDERAWLDKASIIRQYEGMALLITHPDYIDGTSLRAYERLLDRLGEDDGLWCALPGEVTDWWRTRAASNPIRQNGRWSVQGPAANRARLRYLQASSGAA